VQPQSAAVLESRASFVDGKKEGTQLFFDETGNVLSTAVYEHDKLLDSRIGPEEEGLKSPVFEYQLRLHSKTKKKIRGCPY
jgi:hypothetical protein